MGADRERSGTAELLDVERSQGRRAFRHAGPAMADELPSWRRGSDTPEEGKSELIDWRGSVDAGGRRVDRFWVDGKRACQDPARI